MKKFACLICLIVCILTLVACSEPCFYCDDTGQMYCKRCLGGGTYRHICEECSGIGVIWYTSRVSGTSWSEECEVCHGIGSWAPSKDSYYYDKPCYYCDGDGKVTCTHCDN